MVSPVRHAVLLLLGVALVGCSDPGTAPSDGLLIQPDAVAYRPGEEATLEVSNLLRGSVGIGVCPSGMYKQDEPGAGTLVPHALPCSAELITLGPGHRLSMLMPLPAGTAAGEYRFAVRYSVGSSSFEARSSVVRVGAD